MEHNRQQGFDRLINPDRSIPIIEYDTTPLSSMISLGMKKIRTISVHQPVCVSGVSEKLDRQLPQQHAQQKGKKQKKIKILVVKVMVIHDRNDVITSMTPKSIILNT